MKKILVMSAIVVLSFPIVSYAEYYFVACKEGTIFKYSVSDDVVGHFKKGESFIAARGLDEQRLLVYSSDNNRLGYVNPTTGIWYESDALNLINAEKLCSEKIAKEEREKAERTRKIEKEEREKAEAKRKEAEVKAKGVTEGMGGLRWGGTIKEFSFLRNPSSRVYQDYGIRDYMISGIGSYPAYYYFYKNKFYNFAINGNSRSGEMIKQAIISKYGKPKEISPLVLYINPNAKVGTGNSWEVGDVIITLNINEMKNESRLSYIYIPILKLRISDDKKTSEEMKKDL